MGSSSFPRLRTLIGEHWPGGERGHLSEHVLIAVSAAVAAATGLALVRISSEQHHIRVGRRQLVIHVEILQVDDGMTAPKNL